MTTGMRRNNIFNCGLIFFISSIYPIITTIMNKNNVKFIFWSSPLKIIIKIPKGSKPKPAIFGTLCLCIFILFGKS